MRKIKVWAAVLLFICSCCSLVRGATYADDADVLQKLATSLKVDSSWGWTGNDPCGSKWDNINCDANNRVTGIQLADNNLQGTLPSDFNKLTALTRLGLQKNQLSGPLPTFKGLTNLQTAYLGSNNFTSMPADFFSGLNSLQVISIDDNPFEPWSIPDDVMDASTLVNFTASNASITGQIPAFFGNGSLPSLQMLRLSYNNLTGGIPASFNGSSLQALWLNNQLGAKLSGSIQVFGTMTQLTELWVQSNAFTGPIPDFSKSVSLSQLLLRDNRLTGPVPQSVVALQSLKNISLANNALQGPYPDFPNTVTADIGTMNSFCQQIPGPCDSRVNVLLSFAQGVGYPLTLANSWKGNNPCSWQYVTCVGGTDITVLNLVNLQLTGSISSALANLTSLRTLRLSNNQLTGSIPKELASLPNLQSLDVRNNSLSGFVPDFNRSRVTVLTDGNPLLGKPDTSPSPPGSTTPSGSVTPDGGSPSPSVNGTDVAAKKSSSVPVGVIAGSVTCAVVLLCIAAAVCWFITQKRRRQRFGRVQSPNAVVINPPHTGSDRELMKITIAGPSVNGTGSDTQSRTSSGPSDIHVVEAGNMVISIQVLRNVTNNFSEQNVLGRGGFGVVYKGELHDGTKIAVKRMESAAVSSKGLSEFQAEIAVLTKVRHRHLVALLGYCVDGNEKLLVYEYMPQGPLSQHLFDWAQNGQQPLDWKQRLSIALDVARGVEYLHSLAQKSFIHRDLKPSNILLGDDMRAKVSDFGLVKLAPEGKYSVETKLAGTFGYLAPEYAVTGRVTTKVDVFSFGVVLMEMITGRRALDETQPEESMHLVTWFRRVHLNRETFRKAIDPVLDITDETFQSICTVAELAGHCTVREPYQRPDMGHAVNVLSPLVEQWKPTDQDGEDCYGIDLDMTLPQALKKWQAFEGGSLLDDSVTSLDNTQTSIPTKPSGFAESFTSADCR
eukprot:Gb_04994 [translate_table: standard]